MSTFKSEESNSVQKIGELQNIRASYRLNGKNYLKWSQFVRTYLKGKGRLSHLIGTGPAKNDPTFEAWDEENSMIMSWLWDSMEPMISDTCMFMSTAKEIWDFIHRTYSKARDAAQVYEIKVKTAASKQGDKSVTEYANLLQNLWQELDHYRVFEMKCPEDAAILKKFIEKDRVYDFLAGLNPEFDQIRIQILGKEDTPSLEETISLIRAEESRRNIMLEPQTVDGSALATKTAYQEKGKRELSKYSSKENQWKENKDNLWCTYCKKPRHTKEKCWKLNGKPPSREWGNHEGQQRSQAHMAEQSKAEENPAIGGFNGEEIEKLRSLLGSLEKPSGACSLALSGEFSFPFCLTASNKISNNFWIIDSGATDHMTPTSQLFHTYTPCPSSRKIAVANGSLTTVAGFGDIHITPTLILKDVLHVPKLSASLVSIQKLTHDLKCYVVFFPSYCVFQDQVSRRRIGLAKERNGLYHLEPSQKIRSHLPLSFLSSSNKDTIWLYHLRLGHPSFRVLKVMFPKLFQGLDISEFHCDICELAKHTRVSFPISNKRSSHPFHLIHSDIWGPSTIPNISGARWFVSLIDDCTRVTWIFLLKQKSDVSTIIPNFHSMIQNQFGVKIKRFRTDNARDYFNQILSSYFQSQGIIHESSCVYTPQQNGVAERKNGHLLNTTRTLLFQGNVPKSYWGEAVLTAAHMINRFPSQVLDNKSPIEILNNFYPHFRTSNGLTPRVFGSTVFVHIHNQHRGKLDPRAIKCVFVGYSSTQKGYKCYNPSSKKLYISADVTFAENAPFFSKSSLQGEISMIENNTCESFEPLKTLDLPDVPARMAEPEPNSSKLESSESPTNVSENFPRFSQVYSRRKAVPELTQVQESNSESGNEITVRSDPPLPTQSVETSADIIGTLDLPIAVRKGTRECTKRPLYPLSHYVSLKHMSPAHKKFIVSLNTIAIPNTVSEALSKGEWRDAMKEEMSALEKNKTWEIVERPKGKNIVDCKWVFTLKYKADGSLERYKARLVAKGYTQTYGVDYQETFAPVAKMNTVRILLSLAAHFNWPLLQYDVKNAFLHGDLNEEIYMNIPPGFRSDISNKVCKLKKALYGLKQSPRAWFGRFAKVMKDSGYKQSQGDHTLFIKHSATGVTALLVYVDDIIVTGNDERGRHELRQRLVKEFEIKELGRLKYFLGIEVAHSTQGIFISQQKYVTDLLVETGKIGCKPISTPMDPNHKLGEAKEEPAVDKGMYQRLIGRLIYLVHTRPDIAYSVNVLSQFMHDPREPHLQAAHRVLHYLKGNPGKGILFKRNNNNLAVEAYTDADYAGSLVDRRSTTGYCTFLGGNLVTWRSKKQNVVARSSAESEFRALAQGLCELLWLKIILNDLRVKWETPMKLFCDNKSAINIAHNPIQHDRTKHIEIDRHFIKEKLEEGLVCMSYVPSESQLADVLTKGLNNSNFHDLVVKLGMEDIYSSA